MPRDKAAEDITLLGKKNVNYHYDYCPEILETFENRHPDNDYWVKFNCPEFTARIVDRWQELEQQAAHGFAIPQTMSEALRLAADLSEQRDKLALENKAQAEALADAQPKVAGFDLITAGEKSITIREAAKLLGIKETRLTSWLHEHGWTYRLNGRWVAKQEHIQGGRLIYKEARYTDEKTGHEVYAPYCHITPKGLSKLARVFGSSPEALAA